MNAQQEATQRIDRLLDAIDLIKADRREEALPILRGLIQQHKDFEDAWLWMSVAVDSIDQSVLCLDNVLRINPNNAYAAAALYRLRQAEMASEQRRARLRGYRDMSIVAFWLLFFAILIAILMTSTLQTF